MRKLADDNLHIIKGYLVVMFTKCNHLVVMFTKCNVGK